MSLNKWDRQQLDESIEKLKMVIGMLDHCNHSRGNRHDYAHHVRDRISESLVTDLESVICKIKNVSSNIADEIAMRKEATSDERDGNPLEREEDDAVPF